MSDIMIYFYEQLIIDNYANSLYSIYITTYILYILYSYNINNTIYTM